MIAEPACHLCGTPAPPVEPGETPVEPGQGADAAYRVPLTWTTSVENGRLRVFCASCSRTHLRSIEGKLDSAWW
jgi:hypothetical protein